MPSLPAAGAYLADEPDGLRVVDVSDPAHPVEVGAYGTPGSAYGVTVAGGYAYVADRLYGLLLADLSDPSKPTWVRAYDTPGNALGAAVSGEYFYVADGETGLIVLTLPYEAYLPVALRAR